MTNPTLYFDTIKHQLRQYIKAKIQQTHLSPSESHLQSPDPVVFWLPSSRKIFGGWSILVAWYPGHISYSALSALDPCSWQYCTAVYKDSWGGGIEWGMRENAKSVLQALITGDDLCAEARYEGLTIYWNSAIRLPYHFRRHFNWFQWHANSVSTSRHCNHFRKFLT
jgi:hypothetical protein